MSTRLSIRYDIGSIALTLLAKADSGFYSGIFIMFLQNHAAKERTDNANNPILYALCVLYSLSTAIIVFDVANFVIGLDVTYGGILIFPHYIVASTLFGCCDFIAQSILIYRCWIVWHQNIHVVVIPSVLAIAFLATWIASITAISIEEGQILTTRWGAMLNITGLVLSMIVNALVTGLIVFKIFKVFRQVKDNSDNGVLNVNGGTKFQSIIFIIIESGMALFSIQFARLVVTAVGSFDAFEAFQFIAAIQQMLDGITPTIILVRVSMGLSFYDETSLVEAAESVLRFGSGHPNPIPGTGSISQDGNIRFAPDHQSSISEMGCINQEKRDDVGGSNDIRMVDR